MDKYVIPADIAAIIVEHESAKRTEKKEVTDGHGAPNDLCRDRKDVEQRAP